MTQKTAKSKCDKLFSEIVRSYGECENCGGSHYLQAAHVNSRRFSATRTDFRNCLCLCAACHRYFHDYPKEFSRFITNSQVGKYYDETFQKSRTATKMDWIERYKQLMELEGKTLKELRDETN